MADLDMAAIRRTIGDGNLREMRAAARQLADEVDRLRAQLGDDLVDVLAERDAQITRVRELHSRREDTGNCAARCYTSGLAPAPWPCPTIQALGEVAADG